MKKLIATLALVMMGISFIAAPVFADEPEQTTTPDATTETTDDESTPAATNKGSTAPYHPEDCNGVHTAILGENGCFEDDTNGGGVIKIILIVIDILTVGVGVIGVIGISVVGIQYLTAGGSEEKVRTAKRRIFEIVLGLAFYAIMYFILKWLLPTFIETPTATP